MRQDSMQRDRERGMSLVEVVVAVVVLGVFSAAVLGVILQTQSAGVTNRARVAASNLAAREIDMVRDQFTRSNSSALAIAAAGTQTNPDPLDGQAAGAPLQVDGMSYTVVREVAWNLTGNGQSACDGGSLVVYPTLGVRVSVSWPHMGSVKPVVSTASLAPAKGQGIPGTASFVAVKVVDSLGQPSPDRGIKVSGGSESHTATTDDSGCAVVQVSPVAGVGTTYTAQATDPGYVDISGTTGPVKNVGQIAQGQLNNSVTFTYDRAGTVQLHLVDPSGGTLDPATVAGATVTLVAGESSGATSASNPPVTGLTTTVSGLWPTSYGAFFGVTPPTTGYSTTPLPPGGTITIDVPVVMATGSLTGVPATSTSVIAVPGGSTTCTTSGARPVSAAGFSLVPGDWSFFATGPTFTCAPGPSAVSLAAGPNDGTPWVQTTLSVSGAPTGGTLWAVSRSKVPGATLTSCPGGAYAGVAVNVDSARTSPVVIPAGDWYVYRTDGAAGGACLGIPGGGQYSKVLTYGVANTLVWVAPNAVITVNGAPTGSSRAVVYSTSATVPSCSRYSAGWGYTTATPSGQSYLTPTLAPDTYYFYSWNQGKDVSGARCFYGGKVILGGQPAYTLPFSSSSPQPTVGP
jgi:prepilin-type N-terminal cleavage/methylation domain-containing protein